MRAWLALGPVPLRAKQRCQNEGQVRKARLCTQQIEKIESALHRHQFIRQHQVKGWTLRELLEGFVNPSHRDRLESREVEFAGEAFAAVGQIVDDEDAAAETLGFAFALFQHGVGRYGHPEAGTLAHFAAYAD